MIELRHLRYFLAVAEELHFGRAAQRLHIAQPPLSRQISQLEDHLETRLFHRTKRQVILTEAGKVLVEESGKILTQMKLAQERTRQAGRGEYGRLRIGFISTAIYNVLPDLVKQFGTHYPDIEIILQEMTGNAQLSALYDAHIDIGIMTTPTHRQLADIAWASLYREPLLTALPESHSLARPADSRALSLKKLCAEKFILFPRPLAPDLYDKIISQCEQAGFSPAISQEAVQMQTIISLVSAGLGIAIVPASMQNLQREGVIYRSLRPQTPVVETAIVWRMKDLPTTAECFIRFCETRKQK